jgi:hypothetical protein
MHLVIQSDMGLESEFSSLEEAMEFVAKNHPDFILVNYNEDEHWPGLRYLAGGYREGMELFIVEKGK